jgi:hypothetical protein
LVCDGKDYAQFEFTEQREKKTVGIKFQIWRVVQKISSIEKPITGLALKAHIIQRILFTN